MAFKINNPFTSRYSNSNIPRGMQKMESNTPLFNHEAGHSGNTEVETETRTSKSYTPGTNVRHVSSGGGKCNPETARDWTIRRISNMQQQFKNEDGKRDFKKGKEMLDSYHQFIKDYRSRRNMDSKYALPPCKRKSLFDTWIRKQGKTDPEFVYNYNDSWYRKYRPKQYEEWKEINKGLLTTITEQRDITTTTNENQRPSYEKRWEEIVEDDGTYKGMNFEEWKEESIQYNIDNPTSSSTSTNRNVGDWKIVSEETEETN